MVENEIRGPLRAGLLRWRPLPSTFSATIVCKATFLLRPGEAILSSEPDGIQEEDNHWDDDSTRSVYAPCDLYPAKPRADILLVGSAFAPGQKPVRELVARLAMGEIDKSIRVNTDRSLRPDGELVIRSSFAKMPLRYERAAGGPDTWNPVGMPPDAPPDALGLRALPNLEPVGRYRANAAEWPEPIGYGPVAPSWPGRRLRAGRSPGFPPRDWAASALPPGLDQSWFNVAPADQQPQRLDPRSSLLLENMHIEHSMLKTRLPDLAPRVRARRAGRAELVEMILDTLWIDTQRAVCAAVWRGTVVLSRIDEPLQLDAELAARPPMAPPPSVSDSEAASTVLIFGQSPANATLPFTDAAGPSPLAKPSGPSAPPPPERSRPPGDRPSSPGFPPDDSNIAHTVFGSFGAADPLPFADKRPGGPRGDIPPPTMFLPDVHEAYPPVPSPPPADALLPRPSASASPPAPLSPTPISSQPVAQQAPPQPPLAKEPAWIPRAAEPPSPWAPAAEPASPWAGGANQPMREPSREPERIAIPSGPMPAGASVGVLAVSNAAAQALKTDEAEDSVIRPAPSPAQRPAPRGATAGETVSFVWVDPEALPRIRRHPDWRALLEELENKPRDPDLDDPAFARDPMDIEDRRDVLEILARAPAADSDALRLAARDAAREDGKYAPPYVLCAGDLVMQFDETATLQAMLATVVPILQPSGDPLKPLVDLTKEFLSMPGLLAAPPVAEALKKKIEDAFRSNPSRQVRPTYLEEQTERALVLARKYQRRHVFGGVHVRALLSLPGGQSFVVYLPEVAANLLPLQARFGARFVSELQLPVDSADPGPGALWARALARVARASM